MNEVALNNIPTAVTVKPVLKLITAHTSGTEQEFKSAAMDIAKEMELNNKSELALYIYAQFGETRTFEIND